MAPTCRWRPALALGLPLCLGLALSACGPRPGTAAPTERAVAQSFVERVVLPNYTQLVAQTAALQEAIQRLSENPSDAQLAATRQAWLAARRTWETSESWAFDPAETNGFDGAMDDWPVNGKDLATALGRQRFGSDTFAALSETAKGFHGIEWVLYGGRTGSPPTAAQLTPGERAYLRLAADDLHRQAAGLLASWSGPEGFGARFSRPGEAGAAVQEMLQGVIGLLQEGGDEKLGQPLKTRDPRTLESADSGNTQADLVANVEGARRVLMATGLVELIGSRDPDLARQIDRESAAAVAMAKGLPDPLNGALSDPTARQAMEALISQLHSTAKLVERSVPLLS
ncbi:imelysin family protein [Cyanobium gracile]|uniref:Putative periplasmic lipoprotein n=1 Tax=Cyanobium gracile (strain ATCC 27147 / PCC 6307) TaxID=292564 RepID=K9P4Z7_CYAGP|nr:imelysin family protein [Cyanobium gracile]AFY28068.1 putative periplasmic lipoprotein [Cyanobium gracile PCC 6307]